jgi:hypothetical protein
MAFATGGSQTTEVVFATRGPHSSQDFASAANKGTILHKVYGDMGSPFLKRMNEWWPKETPYRIDIMDP